MKKIARWVIGNTTKNGYDCLIKSISTFSKFYSCDIVILRNCPEHKIPSELKKYTIIDQNVFLKDMPVPKGVSWKLYPPRLDISSHEISIDNDIVFNKSISNIDKFFLSSTSIVSEDLERAYGKFDQLIPKNLILNSGIYGFPPGYDFESFVKEHCGSEWEDNAFGFHEKNKTFDEQGIVSLAVISFKDYLLISESDLRICSSQLKHGKAHHFIGLNKIEIHKPYQEYKKSKMKIFL